MIILWMTLMSVWTVSQGTDNPEDICFAKMKGNPDCVNDATLGSDSLELKSFSACEAQNQQECNLGSVCIYQPYSSSHANSLTCPPAPASCLSACDLTAAATTESPFIVYD